MFERVIAGRAQQGTEIAAIDYRHASDAASVVTVRIHDVCCTGEAFASVHCDCLDQRERALELCAERGGVLLIDLGHEGRGIGLSAKVDAYALQELGHDTFAANRELGFADDERDYTLSVQVLRTLGIDKVVLLTENPDKTAATRAGGINVVSTEPLRFAPRSARARRYLQAKRVWRSGR